MPLASLLAPDGYSLDALAFLLAPDGLPVCAVYYANLAAAELKIEGHASQAAAACR
jgi:hypothetical protein